MNWYSGFLISDYAENISMNKESNITNKGNNIINYLENIANIETGNITDSNNKNPSKIEIITID